MKKNEALLIGPQNSPNLPLPIVIDESEIHFSKSIRNLGVIFDDKLSMKNKLVKCVSLPTWSCVELAQLDMPSQLRLPKPLSHLSLIHI